MRVGGFGRFGGAGSPLGFLAGLSSPSSSAGSFPTGASLAHRGSAPDLPPRTCSDLLPPGQPATLPLPPAAGGGGSAGSDSLRNLFGGGGGGGGSRPGKRRGGSDSD
mmetsp:Transcript_27754/g.90292  ORF Transcript_27754/g.90292 Transcript_27754/m.90292 type:complete len:107 (+) Transcript_27754:304-624(+)